MESRTFQVLEFPKILGVLSGFATSEPGASECLSIHPHSTLEAVLLANELFDQAASWVGESGFRMRAFPDLGGIFPHLSSELAVLDQDALFALKIILDLAMEARESLSRFEDRGWEVLKSELFAYDWPQKTVSGIGRCLDAEGQIRDESSPALMDVRQEIRAIHQRCTKRVKDFIIQENMGAAMQDEFMTISSDRYVLPIKANFKNKTKGIIHDYSQTGETCYFEPIFLVETNNRLQELKREERAEEYKVLQYLTGLIRQEKPQVSDAYRGLVTLDVLMAKVRLAGVYNGRTIEVTGEGAPRLLKSRHPLLALTDESVHPLNIELEEGQRAMIVSGGNAGGKTVCLKTVGLIGLMAFSGLPVPAAEGSRLPFWSDIFVIMGDEQSLEENVSTFTAQIKYLRRVWDQVDDRSLFILDEFGAGTDPTQGAALAQAVIDSLLEKRATAFTATHFPALKAYAMATRGVRAASVLFDPDTKKPLFRLAYDQVGASIALDVAKEHGLPNEILERAEKYLLLDGSDTTTVLDRLNAMAVKKEQELDAIEDERARIEKKRANLEAKFEKERVKLLKDVQSKAQDVVKQWKSERIGRKEARKKLHEVRLRIEDIAPEREKEPAFSFSDIVPGMKVSYLAWNKSGTVLEINDKKKQAKVDIGGVAMWVKADHLGPAVSGGSGPAKPANAKAPAPSDLVVEVDLRGNRADMAISELERAMDAALRKGAGRLEIVHGRGTGALRREVHEFLKHYPAVESFALAPEDRGGDGMTEVTLK
ncbi:endonuclease MutS2 [Pseudodesulfovibrio indicus]|uniref:Endonuclease MutS2 n=1 Tax=Pseudodesulfovibrio indicus TaxID=1716143 RepID=A0A126QPK7_9BACT|nr:Smr/MutS family protein [Pseudodesulfovibrio indicus]AMK11749.1 DNA mismatch repair protein MutS [Pseudodesulfovibrio indicus]TDT88286.1 DNA mismatch repair protein MutS2 [Pseudodesulfovibrio indicus]